jgi:hypothetical protein
LYVDEATEEAMEKIKGGVFSIVYKSEENKDLNQGVL